MAYDVQQLLRMSQQDLDALFTASDAGPIPEGQADGTAIIAPGTTYSHGDRDVHQVFRLAR